MENRIICRVSCEIVEPFPDRPNEGFFNFTIEFSPMADPSFEVGRPSEVAIELGRIIERGLRESKAIDTEALCIISGEKVEFLVHSLFKLAHFKKKRFGLCAVIFILSIMEEIYWIVRVLLQLLLFVILEDQLLLFQEDNLLWYSSSHLIFQIFRFSNLKHSLEEHEPVALNIHHIPVCVTFAFFNNGY